MSRNTRFIVINQLMVLSFVRFAYTNRESTHLESFRMTYIGILTQPNDIYMRFWDDDKWDYKNSYVATSYIKYVEATGAQSVIIPWDMPWDNIEHILENTHGLIIPGGNANLFDENPLLKVIHKIYEWSKIRNDDGYPFFLIGICMGFEVLTIEMAKTPLIMTTGYKNFDEQAVIVNDISKMSDSPMFGGSVKEVREVLKVLKTNHNVRFAHNEGVSVEKFYDNNILRSENEILATANSQDGEKFVAIIESKIYPFFGMQFHPEKNSWEKRYKKYYKLNRDANTLAVQNGFVNKAIDWSRKMRNYDFEIQYYDKGVQNLFSYNFQNYPCFFDIFESIVMVGDMSDCNGDCYKKAISKEMEDYTMKSYQSMRNKFREQDMSDDFSHTFIDPNIINLDPKKVDQ